MYFVSPKGSGAFILFEMTKEEVLNASLQNLEAVKSATQLVGASKITIVYRLNKVSAFAKIKGRSYGGAGTNHQEAIAAMQQNVADNIERIQA